MNARSQSDNVGVSAYASYIRTDGDNVSRVGNEDDGYDNMTAGININYAATSEHTLLANLRTVQYENDYDGTDFVTTGLPADSDNVTDGSQISAKLRWEFAPENTGYRSALSAHYRKDDNDNTESGADTGGTTGERIELNWTGFYTMDNRFC